MRKLLSPRRPQWIGFLCLALSPALARAAGTETRLFAVQVDGKPAGECRLTYTTNDDGSETLSGSAAVRVRHVLGTYRYNYDGSEVWKANQVQKLACNSDDDGKKCVIRAEAEQAGLRVIANGRASMVRADVWPTTYWRLPAPQQRSQSLPLLDMDTGRVLNARLDAGAAVKVFVGGQAVDCTFYRVSGQAQADLWYDTQGRLVREVTVEDGHRTVLELKEIRR